MIVEPYPEAGFESSDRRFLVRVPHSVIDRVTHVAREGLPDETGGLLLGTYSGRHSVLTLRDALPPPLDSIRSRRTFVRGTMGLSDLVGGVLVDGHLARIVGEWHSHPASASRPSPTDQAQMVWAAARRLFGCPTPILLIIGNEFADPDDWTVTVFPRLRPPVPTRRQW